MDPNNLYQSCLKMLNDKYKINDYPKDVFMEMRINSTIKQIFTMKIKPLPLITI